MSFAVVTPYADLDYANGYIAEYYPDAAEWNAANDATKTRWLRQGTEMINRLQLAGYKTDEDQVNVFPRGGDTDIPEDVQKATCEIAVNLSSGTTLESLSESTGIQSESIGSASVSYSSPNISGEQKAFLRTGGGLNSLAAFRLLAKWIVSRKLITLRRA